MTLRTRPPFAPILLAAAALLAPVAPAGTAARAEEIRRIPLEIGGDAGSCRALDEESQAEDAARRLRSREAMARLQAQLQQELAAGGGEPPVVLNGRGYNYGREERADPLRELEVLRREVARQQGR